MLNIQNKKDLSSVIRAQMKQMEDLKFEEILLLKNVYFKERKKIIHRVALEIKKTEPVKIVRVGVVRHHILNIPRYILFGFVLIFVALVFRNRSREYHNYIPLHSSLIPIYFVGGIILLVVLLYPFFIHYISRHPEYFISKKINAIHDKFFRPRILKYMDFLNELDNIIMQKKEKDIVVR